VRTRHTLKPMAPTCAESPEGFSIISLLPLCVYKETGILLPNNQRQHRTSHASKDVLPLRICANDCAPSQPLGQTVLGWIQSPLPTVCAYMWCHGRSFSSYSPTRTTHSRVTCVFLDVWMFWVTTSALSALPSWSRLVL